MSAGVGVWQPARRDRGAPGYAQLDDGQLVVLLRRRDARALETLYDRYCRLAYSVAVRILADEQRAEDVVQDVYVKLWRQPELFDASRGRFQPWFLRMVHHRAVDWLRSSRRERSQAAFDPEGEVWLSLPDPQPHPEEQVAATLDRETVEAALSQLPPAQREVIDLAYFAGMTQAEIAEHLGEPLGTVKTRVRLGMRRLRDLLARSQTRTDRG